MKSDNEHELFLLQRAELEKTHRQAPWLDFADQPIFEGDIIQHPSGEQGKVIFIEGKDEPESQWRVKYTESDTLSRLCLQLGNMGQAAVIGRPLEHIEMFVEVIE